MKMRFSLAWLIAHLLGVGTAAAHYLTFLPPVGAQKTTALVFGKNHQPEEAVDAGVIPLGKVWVLDSRKENATITPKYDRDHGYWVVEDRDFTKKTLRTRMDYGVANRGEGRRYLLRYHASLQRDWSTVVPDPESITLLAKKDGDAVALALYRKNQPIPDAEIVVMNLEGGKSELAQFKTKKNGLTSTFQRQGWQVAQVHYIEQIAGEYEGRPFTGIHHYVTLTWSFPKE